MTIDIQLIYTEYGLKTWLMPNINFLYFRMYVLNIFSSHDAPNEEILYWRSTNSLSVLNMSSKIDLRHPSNLWICARPAVYLCLICTRNITRTNCILSLMRVYSSHVKIIVYVHWVLTEYFKYKSQYFQYVCLYYSRFENAAFAYFSHYTANTTPKYPTLCTIKFL